MPQDNTAPAPDFAELAQLLRQGQVDTVDQALTPLPDSAFATPQSRMLRVRLHLAKGDPAKAAELAKPALEPQAKQNPWIWQLMLQVLCANDQIDKAQALFQSGLSMALDKAPDAIQGAVDQLLDRIPDREEQIAFLDSTLAAHPDVTPVRLRLASRLMLAGRSGAAADQLRQAEAEAPLPPYAQRMKTLLSPFLTSYGQGYEDLRDAPDAAAIGSLRLRRMARFASAAGRHDDAYQAVTQAVQEFPGDWQVLYRIVRCKLSMDQRRSLVEQLQSYGQTHGTDQSWDLQLAVLLLQLGQAQAAQALLEPIHSHTAIGWSARSLSAALNALGPKLAAPRDIPLDQEIVHLPKDGATGTLIVFTNGTAGVELLPSHYFDLVFADLPLNLIYLRDFSGLVFQNGLQSMAGGRDELHAHLRQMTADSPGPIATLGNCFAGHSATRAAMDIGATHAISLAGLLSVPEEDSILISQGLAELRNAGEVYDLVPKIKANKALQVTHAYGAKFDADAKRARALSNIRSVKKVRLHQVNHHYVGTECVAQGLMPKILKSFLG